MRLSFTVIKIIGKSKWPKNFEEDKDEPGMGVWHCPDCYKLTVEGPEQNGK